MCISFQLVKATVSNYGQRENWRTGRKNDTRITKKITDKCSTANSKTKVSSKYYKTVVDPLGRIWNQPTDPHSRSVDWFLYERNIIEA